MEMGSMKLFSEGRAWRDCRRWVREKLYSGGVAWNPANPNYTFPPLYLFTPINPSSLSPPTSGLSTKFLLRNARYALSSLILYS